MGNNGDKESHAVFFSSSPSSQKKPGWTLYATKKTYNFDYTAQYTDGSSFTQAVPDADSAGHVPGDMPWTQILFRFANAKKGTYAVYNRNHNDFDE